MIRLIALLVIAMSLLAAEPPPKDPVIPPDLAAKFWKAESRFLSALATLKEAEAERKNVSAELIAACKGTHIPTDSKEGLTCVPKPNPKTTQ